MTRPSSVALLSAALALGCAQHQERAPATCVGDCGLSPGLGTGLPTNPGGEGGANGEGGSDSGTSSKGVELTGDVRLLNDDLEPEVSAQVLDEVDLKVEGENGKLVTGLWNGADPFTLADVPPLAGTWVLATPKNAVADDALPALNAVRTNNPDSTGTVNLSLYLARATSIDHLFELATTVPLSRDTAKAQVILHFVTKTGSNAPLAGIAVKASGAEDVLYGASSGFSDVATETDNTGVAVLANVPSAAWPGGLVTLQITGAKTGGGQLHAVTGAVTIATVEL